MSENRIPAVTSADGVRDGVGKLRASRRGQADVAGQERGPWRDDLVAAVLATALVGGLFVDGWNHINLQDGALGSFFTIWHALLYAGFSATALWVVSRNPHLYRRGHDPEGYFHPVVGIPLRYPLAVAGLAVATVGLFGDLVWHTAFGEEQGVARVIAPFHLLLFAGAAGLVAAPLRSGWYAREHYPTKLSFGTFLPPLLSLTLVTAVVAFMFQWFSAFVDWTPAIRYGRIPAELAGDERVVGTAEFAAVARVLVTNALLLAPLLVALKRWRLPFGSATFLFAGVAAPMAALSEFALGGAVLAAVAGGLATDALIRWLRAGGERVLGVRVVAGLAPIAVWAPYFLLLRAVHGIVWPLDLWLGTTLLAAITGILLSFVAAAPATPVPYAEQAGRWDDGKGPTPVGGATVAAPRGASVASLPKAARPARRGVRRANNDATRRAAS